MNDKIRDTADDLNAAEMAQWELDHPDGAISAEEDEAMAQYAADSCREEGCR